MKDNILIADDEESVRFTFTSFLQDGGYQVATADSLSSCIKNMQTESFDLLFLDIGLGCDNGIEAIQELKVMQPKCSIVIITGEPGYKAITKARGYGAVDYLVKPIRQASLLYIAQKTLVNKVATNQ
ncbi:MAG: response regulator [Desulfuromonadales bacterium]|nr:response regulator [Desulfuromonadales bacterium]